MRMRYTASSIPSLKDRTFFFDANSLIYIFWPTSPDSQEAVDYGSIFATLINNNATLAINEIVISEIVNRVLQIEFSKTSMSKDKFKYFRDSAEGRSVQEDIYTIIRNKILGKFQIISDVYSKEEVTSLLSISKLDFNDKVLELLCKKKNMVLLTHDHDFSASDVDILTSNKSFSIR